ncbi:6363_t:CDS:2, partial [Acaulospora colombiana]
PIQVHQKQGLSARLRRATIDIGCGDDSRSVGIGFSCWMDWTLHGTSSLGGSTSRSEAIDSQELRLSSSGQPQYSIILYLVPVKDVARPQQPAQPAHGILPNKRKKRVALGEKQSVVPEGSREQVSDGQGSLQYAIHAELLSTILQAFPYDSPRGLREQLFTSTVRGGNTAQPVLSSDPWSTLSSADWPDENQSSKGRSEPDHAVLLNWSTTRLEQTIQKYPPTISRRPDIFQQLYYNVVDARFRRTHCYNQKDWLVVSYNYALDIPASLPNEDKRTVVGRRSGIYCC